MDLQSLRYFMTVARMGNISHAAAAHYVPQSAMSRSIAKLEAELGVKLFDRTHNRIELNENGIEFSKSVGQILRQLDDTVDLIRDDDQNPRGEIDLLVLQFRPLLASCISAFTQKYADVTFSISHDYKDMLAFDHGLCISSVAPNGIPCDSELLIREELFLAVSKRHPLASRSIVRLNELRNEHFLIMSKSNSLWSTPLEHCRKYGFELVPKLECNDAYCLWKYIVEGIGIAFISPVSWQDFDLKQISLLRINEPDFYRNTYMFWPSGKKQPHTTQLFAQYLRDVFAALPK